jgi:hypothetical protein
MLYALLNLKHLHIPVTDRNVVCSTELKTLTYTSQIGMLYALLNLKHLHKPVTDKNAVCPTELKTLT